MNLRTSRRLPRSGYYCWCGRLFLVDLGSLWCRDDVPPRVSTPSSTSASCLTSHLHSAAAGTAVVYSPRRGVAILWLCWYEDRMASHPLGSAVTHTDLLLLLLLPSHWNFQYLVRLCNPWLHAYTHKMGSRSVNQCNPILVSHYCIMM